MFITKVIIHNYLREKQKLNKCSSMNPLLLLLLLLNKQAQTQISWFYYLFNDCKRRQSKYRWNAHSLSRSTILQLFNRAHIVIRYFFPCFFFNRKKKSLVNKSFKASLLQQRSVVRVRNYISTVVSSILKHLDFASI